MTHANDTTECKKLNGKIVVLCGGAGLIGKSLTEAVLLSGGTAVIADKKETSGKTLVETLKKKTGANEMQLAFFQVDITDKITVNALINAIAKKYGRIDALVNTAYPKNANYGVKFEDVLYLDFCENVNLHLGGYFLTAQQFAVFFNNQGFGNIVNFSSIYGVIAPRFEIYDGTSMTMPVEYAVIKSGIIHLTRYLANYYKGKNLRCNCISPGGIADRQPASFAELYNAHGLSKGLLNAQDLCGTLLFLLSDDSRFINGQNIIVDDGFTLS